ncbi:MAG: hypothetical protein P9M00_13245 [Candidatus Tritonobacter lacicola]|nr:hypothetical protein [Candidatus Tritonobacter lacicola]
MIKNFFCSVLILALPAAVCSGGEKVLLQYRHDVGLTLNYKMNVDGTIVFKQLGGWVKGEKDSPKTISMKKELYSSAEVVSRSNGRMNVVYRFDKGFSEKTKGRNVKKTDLDFKGEDIRIKMWPDGKTEIENIGALEKVYRKSQTPYLEEPLLTILPKKRLKIGATWKQKFTRQGLFIEGEPISYTVRYKLAEIEEYKGVRCAVIEGRAKLGLKNYQGKTRKGKKVDVLKAEEKMDSVMYFDIERGTPIETRKTIKRHETREWEAKGDKEPYRDELDTEVTIKAVLVGSEQK